MYISSHFPLKSAAESFLVQYCLRSTTWKYNTQLPFISICRVLPWVIFPEKRVWDRNVGTQVDY